MKRIFLTIGLVVFFFSSIFFYSCKNEKTDENETDTTKTEEVSDVPQPGQIPYDFPVVGTTAKNGEYVLTPSYAFIEDAWKDPTSTFIFYSSKTIEVGDKESKVSQVGTEYMIPNSLIIAIPANQQVKKGDVVLTWRQSGSGMERGIVVDDSDPSRPKVKYLDIEYDNSATNDEGVPIGQMIEELEANSFVKITTEWQPGTSIAYQSDYYQKHWQVIRVEGEKVLAMGWAGKVQVLEKSKCTAIPVKMEVKAGDIIQIPHIGSYQEATVIKVDNEAGRIWVETEFAGEMTEEVVSQGNITKGLVL